MKLSFELSRSGRGMQILPSPTTDAPRPAKKYLRRDPLRLPQLSEVDISRHYTRLMNRAYGVNNGFYPLGSCTMKYNPRVNEEIASLPGFTDVHPLQPTSSVTGCMEVLELAKIVLCEITGMTDMTFQPAAGAHGELTGLLLIKAYHASRGDTARTKILVPDAAHGTNPASAAMCGYTVVSISSTPEGTVDLEALRQAAGPDTAGLMLTNPNTLGLFDPNIAEITEIVHLAGGLCYYDGANLNAIMGITRPGDMGFDVVHLNLHKTFSTPHGGGGPGSGPVGCKEFLSSFLPADQPVKGMLTRPPQSIGRIRSFYGNFLVVVKALTYILSLGKEGIPAAATHAVLNANYFKALLTKKFTPSHPGLCMHEFVLSLEDLKKETGVSSLDIAKGLIDEGIHPPTMYFPLIVHEALMPEPTETESKETMDEAAAAFLKLYDRAYSDPESLHTAPRSAPIGRPDEVAAARNPRLRWEP
ncbi:MAG: aminomethyl-transferring glycine dehydrogenase subunit GcvPB [Christensenellales bacterium]|jgi:glycine dehydrogenase subunit 2